MVLVVWAASFGLDERGLPEGQQTAASGEASNSHQRPSSSAGPSQEGIKRPSFTQNRQRCKEKTTTMVRELLDLIDYHGLLRKPTWDGVRVLLLLLPLTDGKNSTRTSFTLSLTHRLQTFPLSNVCSSTRQRFLKHERSLL